MPATVLVALDGPPDAHYAARVQRHWDEGRAVAPLPLDDVEARRSIAVVRPHLVEDTDGDLTPLDAGAPPLADDAALVVATSGSRGAPRGVVLSHAALGAAVDASRGRLGLHDERWLACLPAHHVAGVLVHLRAAAASRAPVVAPAGRVPDLAAALEHVTAVALVPTMLGRLLEADAPLGHLDAILVGGAALDPRLAQRARTAGLRVTTSYGMTETCGGVVYDGLPLDGVGVAVAPDDRVWISGPTLASGLRDGGRLDRVGAWLVTSDLGSWTDDGRLVVRSRSDDVVVSGGENVATDAVAAVLRTVPGVSDAAVVGLPDEEWGQRVEAWLEVGHAGDARAAILRAVSVARRDLPRHAVPKRIVAVAALPRSGLGKTTAARLPDVPTIDEWPTTTSEDARMARRST